MSRGYLRLFCVLLCVSLAVCQYGFFTNNNRRGHFLDFSKDVINFVPSQIKKVSNTISNIREGHRPTKTGEVTTTTVIAVSSTPTVEVASTATEEGPTSTSTTAPTTSTPYPQLTPVPIDTRSGFNFQRQTEFHEACVTLSGAIGSCISVVDCPPFLAILRGAAGNPSAVAMLRSAHCGFAGNSPKVCCPTNPIPNVPPPTPEPVPVVPEPASPEPEIPPPEVETEFVELPEPPVCGYSNASFSRVVGGIPAKLGDFPWMALLGYRGRRNPQQARWLCGGSLVSSRHVLTAAHCIHGRENDLYQVRLGELDLAREDEGATPLDVPIQQMIKHEEYNAKAFTNDIALLVLSQNVVFTSLIQPICLPLASELRARSFEKHTPIIAGWGDTEFRGPSATHLQVLQLPVVTNEYCVNAYKAYKAQTIDARVLCAGYVKGGKDACQGDSGGPLMQPIWNTETYKTFFYQIGVVSFGRKCAEAGFPGVYTRTTHFMPWVYEKIVGRPAA